MQTASNKAMQPLGPRGYSRPLSAFLCLLMLFRVRGSPQIGQTAAIRLPVLRAASPLSLVQQQPPNTHSSRTYAAPISNTLRSHAAFHPPRKQPAAIKGNYGFKQPHTLLYRWKQPNGYVATVERSVTPAPVLPPLPLKSSLSNEQPAAPNDQWLRPESRALQPRFSAWQRQATPEIAQQRYQGNYYRQLLPVASDAQQQQQQQQQQQILAEDQAQPQIAAPSALFQGPDVTLGRRGGQAVLNDLHNAAAGDSQAQGQAALVHFENRVLHVTPRRGHSAAAASTTEPTTSTPSHRRYHERDYRQRRDSALFQQQEQPRDALHKPTAEASAMKNSTEAEAPLQEQTELKDFHDIFMRFNGPHSIAFGHIEKQPERYEQRFESAHNGNRFKGEVIWADEKTGGYGAQQWDLVQGRL